MRRDRVVGDDAGLLERCDHPSLRANDRPGSQKRDVRLEPVERRQPQPRGNRPPLTLVRGEVEALAVANLVEPEMVSEAVGHESFPCAMSSRLASSSCARTRFSSRAEWPSAPADMSVLYKLPRAAAVQSPSPLPAERQRSVRLASDPTSLRTVLPSVGSPMPSSRCSASMASMNRSVSATETASPRSPSASSRTSTSAIRVASTANRPSSVSGTPPSTYQCGRRARFVTASKTSAPRLGSAVNLRNRKSSIGPLWLGGPQACALPLRAY